MAVGHNTCSSSPIALAISMLSFEVSHRKINTGFFLKHGIPLRKSCCGRVNRLIARNALFLSCLGWLSLLGWNARCIVNWLGDPGCWADSLTASVCSSEKWEYVVVFPWQIGQKRPMGDEFWKGNIYTDMCTKCHLGKANRRKTVERHPRCSWI